MLILNKKKILITHNGSFHADDLFATAVLSILNKGNIKIIRTRDLEVIAKGDYVYDVGGIYDPENNRFDHHQKGGAGARENGIPYSSFGLIWKKYGEQLCESKEVADHIDKKIVQPIDAIDNGVDIVKPIFDGIMPYGAEQIFFVHTPTWKEKNVNIDLVFKEQSEEISKLLLREIEVAKDRAIVALKRMAREVTTDEEARQVASISAADEKIGALVAEAIKKVTKDGVITVEEGKSMETTVEYKKGLEIDRGYASPSFVTDNERVEAVVEDPYVLITDISMSYNHQIVKFMERVLKVTKNLVVIGDVTEEALATMVINRLKGNINVLTVRPPSFGERRVDELEDIAILTGGTAVLMDSGRDINSVQIEELGRASKIIADREKTVITGGAGSKAALKGRINDLTEQIKVSTTEYDTEIKKERIAKLSGGVAIIKVGAITEVEMKDKKERIIDAVAATKSAIEEGIVAGGETALLALSDNNALWNKPNLGEKILRMALRMPFKKLLENSGIDYAETLGKMSQTRYPIGIDVITGEMKNMVEVGIIDPVKVTRSALENAVSVATMIMTTNTLVSMPYEEHKTT